MSKVIYLPFENLPQRYTQMWNEAIISQLQDGDLVVGVDNAEHRIQVGEFLDVFGTIKHKQRQMQEVAQLFESGAVEKDDVFFVPDIFYPALCAIRYMSELAGIPVRIVTYNHAGRADETDFVQKLASWSDTQEQAWHDMSDIVCVGSMHQYARVARKFQCKDKLRVTGAVWSSEWMREHTADISREKEDYVIYPHRICNEKGWDVFMQAAAGNPSLRFIITSSGNKRCSVQLPQNVEYRYGLTKHEYFELFAHAKGYLSTAFQETFGYTIQEAIFFGCQVIVPRYACCPEYTDAECVVTHADMMQREYLTRYYAEHELTNSKQIEDNANLIYQLCKQKEQ